MTPTFDAKELLKLEATLSRTGGAFTPALMGKVVRKALKPVLAIAQREVPVGETPDYQSLSVTRGRNKGFTRLTTGSYSRGGATRRDLRIRMVDGEGNEVIRGLVGVSKARGKVGWRTHLVTRPNKHRRVADDFLSRTERQGIPLVVASLEADAREVITKEVQRNG